MEYLNRHIMPSILRSRDHYDLLAITGARQTGKTTLCEGLMPQALNLPFSYISFDDPDERIRFQRSAITVLESLDSPLIILDEIQKAPYVMDSLKFIVDKAARKGEKGQKTFVLTGSSQLMLMKNVQETLAGRVAMFHLYPLSLAELLADVPENQPETLLTRIWEGHKPTKADQAGIQALPPARARDTRRIRDEHQAWGGYPSIHRIKEPEDKLRWLKNYRKTYLERDIADVGQVSDTDTFALAQKLLCARTGQLVSISDIARDAALSVNTIKRYVGLLNLTYQCFLLRPFHLNTGKRLIKSPKIYFPDNGVNRAVLGDISISAGAAYESWAFSELLKWKELQGVEPELFFYRTSSGVEVDFVLASSDRLLPIEVKSSDKVGRQDAASIEGFMKEYGKTCDIGIVVYRGDDIVEVRKDIWAVPDWALFGNTL